MMNEVQFVAGPLPRAEVVDFLSKQLARDEDLGNEVKSVNPKSVRATMSPVSSQAIVHVTLAVFVPYTDALELLSAINAAQTVDQFNQQKETPDVPSEPESRN